MMRLTKRLFQYSYSLVCLALLSACVSNPVQRYESYDFSHARIINSQICLAVLEPSVIVWRHYPGGSLKLASASLTGKNRLESVLRTRFQQSSRRFVMVPDVLSQPAHRELIHRVADAVLERPDSSISYSLSPVSESLDTSCDQVVAVLAQAHVNHASDRVLGHDLMLLSFDAGSGRLRLVLRQRGEGGTPSTIAVDWREQLTAMLDELS